MGMPGTVEKRIGGFRRGKFNGAGEALAEEFENMGNDGTAGSDFEPAVDLCRGIYEGRGMFIRGCTAGGAGLAIIFLPQLDTHAAGGCLVVAPAFAVEHGRDQQLMP